MTGQGAVIVTGVSRRAGIGVHVARSLHDAGWQVLSTGWGSYDADRPWGRDESDDRVAPDDSHTWHHLEADLADPDAAAHVFAVADKAVGPVRGLVNCHTHDPGGGLDAIDGDALDKHLAVNVRGTYLMCKEFAHRYRPPHGPGRIVNFLSGPPLIGSVAYAASKGAVHWMTLSLAGELSPAGITVNAIDPGPTDTGWMTPELVARLSESTPIGRVSRPADAAHLVAFLLSDEGGWMNAQFLRSDGGFSELAQP